MGKKGHNICCGPFSQCTTQVFQLLNPPFLAFFIPPPPPCCLGIVFPPSFPPHPHRFASPPPRLPDPPPRRFLSLASKILGPTISISLSNSSIEQG